jgi:hypothetical protein
MGRTFGVYLSSDEVKAIDRELVARSTQRSKCDSRAKLIRACVQMAVNSGLLHTAELKGGE